MKRDPVHQDHLGWWFWNETWADRYGPYPDESRARAELTRYAVEMLGEEKEEQSIMGNIDAGISKELLDKRDQKLAELRQLELQIAAERLTALTEEPKCPMSGCGVGVLRSKCYLDDPNCPRTNLIETYGGYEALKKRMEELV